MPAVQGVALDPWHSFNKLGEIGKKTGKEKKRGSNGSGIAYSHTISDVMYIWGERNGGEGKYVMEFPIVIDNDEWDEAVMPNTTLLLIISKKRWKGDFNRNQENGIPLNY